MYEHKTKKENVTKMQENVFLTSGKLGYVIEPVLSKNLKNENSVLINGISGV